jgi:copper chaperone CopZ
MGDLMRLARRRVPAALGFTALLLLIISSALAAAPADTALTRVKFQLRSDCSCASCGFALRDQLRKLAGVARVDLSPRERVVTVAFDEGRAPLSRVARVVTDSELGKHSALIGELVDARTAPSATALHPITGVRAAELEAKKNRLLVELDTGALVTTRELTAALERAGIAVRFDSVASNGRVKK